MGIIPITFLMWKIWRSPAAEPPPPPPLISNTVFLKNLLVFELFCLEDKTSIKLDIILFLINVQYVDQISNFYLYLFSRFTYSVLN